jgi:ribulose-phosphate 3-epimerase
MDNKFKLAPSILSADFSRLGEQILEISKAGIDYIHIDVMDGHFVPNITIGPLVVDSIKKLTSVPLDVHLMVEHPMDYIKQFAEAGADIITIHVEAERHIYRAIDMVHNLSCKIGISLNPSTSLDTLDEILHVIDMVLIMSVNPGFGGQKFITGSLDKIKRLRQILDNRKIKAEIEVDGGITAENVKSIVKAGADVIVAGYAIFSKQDITEAIKEIKNSVISVG